MLCLLRQFRFPLATFHIIALMAQLSTTPTITCKVFSKPEIQKFLEENRPLHYNEPEDLLGERPASKKPRIADLHERLRYIDRTELWNTHFSTPDPMRYHVALDKNLIVGWASLRESPYQENTLWLQGLAVDPNYRKQGISKQLVTSIAKQAVFEKQTVEVSGFTYLGELFLKPVIESTFSKIPQMSYTMSSQRPRSVCEADVKEAETMGFTSPEIDDYKKRYLTPCGVDLS